MQGMNTIDLTNFDNNFIMFILSHHRAIYSDGKGHNNGDIDTSLLCIDCTITVHMIIIIAIVHEVSF